MWHELADYRLRDEIEIKPVELSSQQGLEEKFGKKIPVLASSERVICHYFLDPVALESFIDSRL